ncbi:helix-turn-helix domain-containing protein [Cohnella sp. GCM10027633]|uniref:helix-turn-helix domain-containing protein n=1 Tax=unclassified Cohnella TaxID=2636738 RepID=UPI00363801B7
MYKVILIDDEDEVREGIKEKTPWAECGFELVGDFENGRDAWEALDALKPDAVITDICMPFMDGLELAQRIFDHYRALKVVIVTGFEDFEYAKRAIRLKVSDYLLKPLNAQEFTDFLMKMKRELDEEQANKADLSRLRSQLHQSLPLLKERFLDKLAYGQLPQDELIEGIAGYRLTFGGPSHLAMVADVDEATGDIAKHTDAELELLRFGVYNIVQEIVEKEHGGIVFRTREHKVAALLSGDEARLRLHSQTIASYIRESVEKYLKLTVCVGIGLPCASAGELPRSFREALSALDYRFMLGANRTLSIQDMEFGSRGDAGFDGGWEKEVVSAMRTGNPASVTSALRVGFDELRRSGSSVDQGYGAVHKLLAAIMGWLAETGLEDERSLTDDAFAQAQAMKTLDSIQRWLEDRCGRILSDLQAKRSTVVQSQMREAELYIGSQYMNEELSLGDVCGHLYMSISYFSTLFKQHTGATFIEYLTRVRMDKAKELLVVTSHKTYEIAAHVGYGDPHYFSVIFKRHTGKTPKEYRTQRKGIS